MTRMTIPIAIVFAVALHLAGCDKAPAKPSSAKDIDARISLMPLP